MSYRPAPIKRESVITRAAQEICRYIADEKLKPGQRIQTIGGILGTITQVNDKEITVKVDETSNVKIKFTRNAIHRVMDDDKDKTEAK